MIAPLSFAAGALTWSAAEYCLHRFVGHGPRRRRPAALIDQLRPSGLLAAFNEEHLAHHTDPMYFAPTSHKAAAAAVVLTVSGILGSLVFGPRRGVSYALGFAAAYAGYEVLHRRIHTHAGRSRYARWMRKHHLYHHHKAPRANHGVTSPLWDQIVGTLEEVPRGQPLKIPRKVAPRWMLDANGEVAAEFAKDYVLVGSARKSAEPEPLSGEAHVVRDEPAPTTN
jgi:hypothetical protein